jgi:hypothetical protein
MHDPRAFVAPGAARAKTFGRAFDETSGPRDNAVPVMAWRLGFDIGGTLTDFALQDVITGVHDRSILGIATSASMRGMGSEVRSTRDRASSRSPAWLPQRGRAHARS